MSEITMKTIESLPLVEEPAEDASIVGWNNGKTVRMPVGAIGGGTKGIVFTYEWDSSAVQPRSIEPLETESGAYVLSCNYDFEECLELLMAGAPVVFVDTDRSTVTSMVSGGWFSGADEKSILAAAPSGPEIHLTCEHYEHEYFYITYNANELYGEYEEVRTE